MTITATNVSKAGFLNGSTITTKKVHTENLGDYAINHPTFTGNIDNMMVLDKNWVVLSYNPIPELHAYMIAANASYAGWWAAWQQEFESGGGNYTNAYNMDDVIDDNIIEAREDMDEVLMQATSYYAISSSDDSNYLTPQEPTSIKKLLYDYYGTARSDGSIPKYKEADCRLPNYRLYLYIELPTALVDGDTYTITLDNGSTATFLFDKFYTISRTIKVNQAGYLPSSTYKWAYLGGYLFDSGPLDLSHASSFSVINADTGAVELTGTPRLVEEDPGYDDDYGKHTSTSSATVLTDANQAWTVDALIGNKVYNMTDGSQGTVTSNTATTVTVGSLIGGANNTFENGDYYSINTDTLTSMFGEDIYRMDISSLSTTGTFFISVPGVGRSWPFKHGADAYDQVGYIGHSGIYHHRAGQSIDKAYTNWPRQQAKTGPEYYHCDNIYEPIHESVNSIVVNSPGPASYDRFDIIGASLDKSSPVTQSAGGYHDAADWDSTCHHLNIAFDMMYAFEFNSNIRSDNQFNIDESGDGVPDILSEVKHGLEVWRIGQDGVSGGIPGQLETWTHPQIDQANDLVKTGTHTGTSSATVLTDSNAYFNATFIGRTITNTTDGSTGTITSVTDTTLTCSGGLSGGSGNTFEASDAYSVTVSDKADYAYTQPMCSTSAMYAAAAAMFARLVAPYDATTASTYETSAINAYNFAKNGANLFSSTTIHGANDRGSGTAYTCEWTEAQADVDPYLMAAKLQLYLLTSTSTYITDSPSVSTILGRFTKKPAEWEWTYKDIAIYCFYPIIQAYDAGYTGLSSESTTWTTWITDRADRLHDNLFSVSYACSFEIDNLSRERMDSSLAWGSTSMGNFCRVLELAYQITSTQKYRDAIALNMDFMLGCNPMGISWMTGVGYVYPVCILSEHSRRTRWVDPVPGLVPYGITGGSKYFTIRDEVWSSVLSQTGQNLISSATQTGGTATVTTSENHGLATGEYVYIEDFNESDYNGKHQITVTGTTTFTFTVDAGATSPATGTGALRRDFLHIDTQRSTIKWRTTSNTIASVGQTEYTVHETITGQMFPALILSAGGVKQTQYPREDTDLHGQWLLM